MFCFLSYAVYLRKISDDERPLRLRLATGPDEKLLSFVLKENETGEVNVSRTSVLLFAYNNEDLVHFRQ